MPLDLEPLDLEPVGSKLDLEPLDLEPVAPTRAERRGQLVRDLGQARAEGEALEPVAKTESGGLLTQAGLGLSAGFAQLGEQANRVLATPYRDVAGGFAPVDFVNPALSPFKGAITRQLTGAADVARQAAQDVEALGAATAGPDLMRKGTAALTSTAPILATAPLAAGSLLPGAVAAGLQSYGSTLGDAEEAYRQRGDDNQTAYRKAILPAVASGAVTALITRLGGATGPEAIKHAMQTGTWRATGREFARQVGFGAAEEWWDQVGQSAIAKLTYRPDLTLEQAVGEATEAGLLGGLVGGVVQVARQTGPRTATPPPVPVRPPPLPLEVDELPAPPQAAVETQPLKVESPVTAPLSTFNLQPSTPLSPATPPTGAAPAPTAEVAPPVLSPPAPSTFNLQPSTLPDVPGVPPPLEGQPYEPGLLQRPEAAMETRRAAELNLQREPAVSPELADAIAAVRGGYKPEVENQFADANKMVEVPTETSSASKVQEFVASGVVTPNDLKVGDQFRTSGDRRVASTGGRIIKVNPTTVVYETDYMGNPMQLTTKKANLTGELRVKRGNVFLSSTYTPDQSGGPTELTPPAKAQAQKQTGGQKAASATKSVRPTGSVSGAKESKLTPVVKQAEEPTNYESFGEAVDAVERGLRRALAVTLEGGKPLYVAPQTRVLVRGKERLVNSASILGGMGAESPALNYYRWPAKPEAKQAEVRPAEPGEQPQPPAQAAPAMQGGMDNLRFTSDPVKTAKSGGADAKDAKAKLIAELEKAVAQSPFESQAEIQRLNTVLANPPEVAFKAVNSANMGEGFEARYRAEYERAKQLLGRLGKNPKPVTIEIPGDGTFTVVNTKQDLSEILAAAKRLQTATSSRWEGPNTARPRLAAREWIAKVEEDATRVYGMRRAIVKLREQAANMDLEIEPDQREQLRAAATNLESRLPERVAQQGLDRVRDQITEVRAQIAEAEAEQKAAKAEAKSLKDGTLKPRRGRSAQSQIEDRNRAADDAKHKLAQLNHRLKQLTEREAATQQELNKALAQVNPSAIDSAIAALEAAKVKPGGLYALPDLGLTVTLWNGTLTAAQVALRAGRTLAQAVQAGVDWLRAQGQAFDEAEVRKALEQGLLQAPGIREHVGKRLLQEDFSPAAKAALEPLLRYEVKPDAQLFAEAAAVVEAIGPMEAEANYFGNPWGLPADAHVVLGFAIGNGLSTLEAQARAAGDTALADRIGRQNAEFQSQFVLQSTETARTLRAYRYFDLVGNLSPFTADLFARKVIEQASQKQKQRLKPTLGAAQQQLTEINRAGINEAARTPEVQGAARTAINQAIEEEAERKDTAVERAITLEVSNTLETLPSVVRKANAAVLGAWDKLSAGEQVRQQTGRGGQGLENSLWSAVKQRGGTVSTVSSVIAQVNRALHEQVNRALGITPQQFVNPTTYLMRLRDALGNAEVMSRIWEQTRAAVGANLAAIDEMERLLVRIEEEIAALEAEAKTPLAGGPEVTAKDAKLKAQQQAARDEMLKGRNANIAEAIRQRRDRIADVTAQLAEYRKMQPAWQAVMGMTVDVWGPNLLRGLLREQMKADGFRLRKAVADHFRGLAGAPDPMASLGTLSQKIIAASGLDEQAAGRLAKDLEAEYTRQVEQERARLAERLAKARERAKAKAAEREANQPKLDAEALIDAYDRRHTEWLKPTRRKSAVRAIVRQALREGAAVAGLNEQVVRGGVQAQLEAVGVPHEAAYRLAYEVWQERQAKGGGIDAVVAARVKELQLDLGRIIRQHWTQVDKAGESLAEHIVGETKMPAEQAERLAAAIQRRFKALVQARKEKALRNLAKTPGARELQKPSVAQRIIEATNLGALDSEGLWQAVADKLGLPTYTADASAEVKRLAERAQQLPEGSVQRRKATADLMNYIARRKGVKRGDLAWAFWYGNVLSDPRTWAVNFGDTGLNALASTAAVFTTEPGGVPQAIRQVPRAVGKGMAEAREVWRTGQDLRTHKEGDLSAPVLALYDRKAGFGPMMAWLYSNVGKVMTATDVFWQQATREMKAVQLARIMAKEEGLTGNTLRLRVEEILNNTTERRGQLEAQLQREAAQMRAAGMEPDALWEQRRLYQLEEELRGPELEARANDFAARTAYNNEPYGVMGAVTNAIELGTRAMEAQAEKTGNERTAALASLARRFVIPFTRIPANAWNERLNYTPLGLARGTWAVLRARVMPDGQQRLYGREVQPGDVAEVLVKGAGGTLAMATLVLAGLKALDDDEGWQIHGAGPRNSDHRKTLRGTKWIPFSFQIGDKFVSFANTPFAAAFAMVGNYVDRHRYKDTDADGALNEARLAAMGAVQVFEQQTYIDAVARTLGLLDNVNDKTPVRMAEVLGRGGASFVPVAGANVLRAVDRADDPKVYQAKTVSDALLFGFPFVRRIGQPALNEFGEPVTLDPMARFYTTRKEDVLVDLVRRGIYPTKPNKAVNRSGREMTEDEFYRYVQESGQAIKRRLETPGMRQMIQTGKEDDARKAVTAIVREERERARRRLGF